VIDKIHWGMPIELGDRRVLREGRLRWLRAVAWMVALFFLVAMSFGPTMEAIRDMLPKDDRLLFLTRCIGAAIALGAYALLVRLGEARAPREIAIRLALLQTLAGIGIGLAMFAVVMAAMAAFGLYDVVFVGPAPAWRAAGLAIEAGVVEELLIRGIALRLLWRAFGPMPAFLVSAALFGAGHLPNPDATVFAALCIAIEAGIMLGAFYALTGRLWVPIGVHAAWNFAQGYLFGAAVSGGDLGPALARSTARAGMPEWLTGGAFGPEASLPALVVCGGVGIATLWLAWRAGRFTGGVAAGRTAIAQTVPVRLGTGSA
jgi:membrane protease YdiL (CAAX protease family)